MRAHASGIERLLIRPVPLALVLVALLCAALSGLAAPRWPVAHADGPTITIASPGSAQGPVQTGIRVVATGWNAGNLADDVVKVFYNASNNNGPCGDPNNSQTLADTNKIPGVPDQHLGQNVTTWTIEFQWPSNTGIGQFYICAFDTTTPTQVTASTQPFNVLSTTLPAITVDKPFLNVGDQITVNGTGFLPGNQPIDLYLSEQVQQAGVRLTTVTAGNDGSFSQKITLPMSPSGQLYIVALSRPSVGGAIPPLSAAQQVTIGATPSTPTPGPSPTVSPSPTATTTASVPTTPEKTTSTSGLILTVLIVLLVLVILAIIGVLIWYVAGTRPPAGVGAPVPPARGRARAPVAPRRGQSGWQSASEWQSDDEWESQQGPWEEDEQGGWNDLPTEWDGESNPWPQNQGGPPSWSGPTGRGNSGAQRPTLRGPHRDDRQGRGRPGQDDW
jgi:hypothetical protein